MLQVGEKVRIRTHFEEHMVLRRDKELPYMYLLDNGWWHIDDLVTLNEEPIDVGTLVYVHGAHTTGTVKQIGGDVYIVVLNGQMNGYLCERQEISVERYNHGDSSH